MKHAAEAHLHARQCSARDVETLAALRRRWTEEQAGQTIVDDDFDEAFHGWYERESGQRLTWLAEVSGDPVGMLNMLVFSRMPRPRFQDRPNQWGYVANVFVLEAHRNSGIGGRLLEAATQYADAHGFARLVLSPTDRSIPFYGRAGFVPATSLLIREPS